MTQWPALPGQAQFTKLAVKQGDPDGKNGVVGAFCRTYDIQRAMDELLPGIYEPVDNMPGRYTYLGGSTTGGAVLYDDGKFLYSHHATDPCGGRLVNAFDLVRLHKYGDKDDTAAAGSPTNRQPSYLAMCEYACGLSDVSALISKERYESAVKDFDGITADESEEPENWMVLLERTPRRALLRPPLTMCVLFWSTIPCLKASLRLTNLPAVVRCSAPCRGINGKNAACGMITITKGSTGTLSVCIRFPATAKWMGLFPSIPTPTLLTM